MVWLLKELPRVLLITAVLGFVACREVIIHNLPERDANRLLAVLDGVGIKAFKERDPSGDGWALSVTRDKTGQALRFLYERRVFPSKAPAVRVERSSFLMGRDEARFRYERAVAQELEHTLSSIKGVLDARVHVNLPRTEILHPFDQTNPMTESAAVLLLVGEDFNLKIELLTSLIAGAVSLPSNRVSVVIDKTKGGVQDVEGELPALSRSFAVDSANSPTPVNFSRNKLHDFILSHKDFSIALALILAVSGSLIVFRYMRNKNCTKLSKGSI